MCMNCQNFLKPAIHNAPEGLNLLHVGDTKPRHGQFMNEGWKGQENVATIKVKTPAIEVSIQICNGPSSGLLPRKLTVHSFNKH